jgi:transcriptional regulator NrdR family protein
MVCIYCSGETQVVNSRHQKRINQTWRRRKCQHCSAVFSTHERPAYEDSWRVRTASGELVPFLGDRLFLSLHKSCEHREHHIEDSRALSNTVISMLGNQAHQGLLETANIAHTAYQVLNSFDTAAAVHYGAFHKQTGS